MIAMDEIRMMAGWIARDYDPQQIILFGSYARGSANERSDVDLLVVKESREPRHRRAAPLYALIADFPMEVEILVYTPSEMDEWRDVPMSLVATALREGKTLYEKLG